MRILVTGGAGFIGSHLCQRLAVDGYTVSVYDPHAGAQTDLPNIAVYRRNICDDPIIIPPCDAVIHLAAQAGVRASMMYPTLYAQSNLMGTLNVLEACRQVGVSKVIFASSSSVYGHPRQPETPSCETDECHPLSPYGWTKLAGEQLCATYARLYGMQILCCRLFSVYGPGQRPDLALPIFARAMLDGEPLQVFGDGTSTRDYTFVDDIVEGLMRGLARLQAGLVRGEAPVLNLGSGSPVVLMDMIQVLARALQVPAFTLEHCVPHPADADSTHADISRAQAMLGWAPTVAFEDGVQRFAAWFRSHLTS